MAGKCLWLAVYIFILSCKFVHADEISKYPHYDKMTSFSANIRLFKKLGMPTIGICSRLDEVGPEFLKPIITNRDLNIISELLEPDDVRSAECLSDIITRIDKPNRAIVKRLKIILISIKAINRLNPIPQRERYNGWRHAPRGVGVCYALLALTKEKKYKQCVFEITQS